MNVYFTGKNRKEGCETNGQKKRYGYMLDLISQDIKLGFIIIIIISFL